MAFLEHLQQGAQMPPLPVVLPNMSYGFRPEIDLSTGEVIGVSLNIQAPGFNVIFSLPFDRLTFAQFVRQAASALGESPNGDTP